MVVNKWRCLGGSVKEGQKTPGLLINIWKIIGIQIRGIAFIWRARSHQLAERAWRALHTRTRLFWKESWNPLVMSALGSARLCICHLRIDGCWNSGGGWGNPRNVWKQRREEVRRQTPTQSKHLRREWRKKKQAEEAEMDHHLLICSFIQQIISSTFYVLGTILHAGVILRKAGNLFWNCSKINKRNVRQ